MGLAKSHIEVGAITNTHSAFGTLIQLVCEVFNIVGDDDSASDAVLFRRFNRTLLTRAAQGKRCVLVCGYAAQARVIDRDILRQVILTRRDNGIMPLRRQQFSHALSSNSRSSHS